MTSGIEVLQYLEDSLRKDASFWSQYRFYWIVEDDNPTSHYKMGATQRGTSPKVLVARQKCVSSE